MKTKKELIKREIAGEYFLVPVGNTVYESNGLFALSELGGFIWDQLEADKSTEEILAAVLEEYDVQEEEAKADLDAFLRKLKDMDIL